MLSVSDSRRWLETYYNAMDAALQAVRADADLSPEADNQALRAYEACIAASDVAWKGYTNRCDASHKATQRHLPAGADTVTPGR